MKIIDNAFYFIIFLRNLTILITSQSIIIVGITYWDATAKKKGLESNSLLMIELKKGVFNYIKEVIIFFLIIYIQMFYLF